MAKLDGININGTSYEFQTDAENIPYTRGKRTQGGGTIADEVSNLLLPQVTSDNSVNAVCKELFYDSPVFRIDYSITEDTEYTVRIYNNKLIDSFYYFGIRIYKKNGSTMSDLLINAVDMKRSKTTPKNYSYRKNLATGDVFVGKLYYVIDWDLIDDGDSITYTGKLKNFRSLNANPTIKDYIQSENIFLGKEKNLRIAFFSDCHYEGSAESGYPVVADGVTQEERLRLLMQHLNEDYKQKPFDFVISGGDTLDGDGEVNEIQKKAPTDWLTKIAPYMPPCPFFTVAGNHDNYVDEDMRVAFGHPRQFSFETDAFYFIMLDQYRHGSDDPVIVRNGVWYGVKIDWDYLNEQVKKAKSVGKEIVLMFHSQYDMNGNELYDDGTLIQYNDSLSDVIEYCENNGIHLLLTGHAHNYENQSVTNHTTIWKCMPGWFAKRAPYIRSGGTDVPWGYCIIEINEGVISATMKIVAHDYTETDGNPISGYTAVDGIISVPASSSTKTITSLSENPIFAADFSIYKFATPLERSLIYKNINSNEN